jgi:xyloglucan-specific exo-beta-1,4-glucanase
LILFVAFDDSYSQSSWQNISTKGMGYVDGLIIHPNTNAKYVRTDVGGVFHYNESTQNWINLTDKLSNKYQPGMNDVEAFAIDKNTTAENQVIYALCGSGTPSYLLKTNNNGNTWTVNQGWNTSIRVYGNGEWRCSGEKLAVDPNNSNVVYCGTRYDGLYKTINAATQWNQVSSFTQRGGNGQLDQNGGISFVVFDPTTTTTVNGQTVTKNIYVGLIDGGVYRSNDGGNAWCYLAGGMDTSKYNPVRAVFNNNRLIVATMADGEGSFDGELWQFIPDGNNCAGGTWDNKTPGLANNYGCPVYGKYRYNAIAIKPNDPNTVYVFSRFVTPRKIFYSNNFNAAQPTWKILTFEKVDGYAGCITDYQKSEFQTPTSWVGMNTVDGGYDWVGDATFDINNPNQIYLTSGNGVIKIEDITTNPAVVSSNNVMKDLEILCVNDMISPPAPNNVPLLTASMDVFGVLYNDFTTANIQKIDNTLPVSAAISLDYSFNNPEFIVTVGQAYNNQRFTINRELKSKDGGKTWRPFYNGSNNCSDIPWGGNVAVSSTDTSNIIWVPNQVDNLPGCATATRTTFPRYTKDGGLTWNTCNGLDYSYDNFPFTLKSFFGIGKMLESDKVNGNKFYLYVMPSTTFSPQIWRTVDGGVNWNRVTIANDALPQSGRGSLKANPFIEGDVWFAPFNNFLLNNTNPIYKKLYHSTNSGETWQPINTIDEVYCYGFGAKVNGSNNAQLIVFGKKAGVESVFVSNDLGVSFTDMGTQNIPKGIITNIVGDMKVSGRIFAATGCRGVWVMNSLNTLPNIVNSFTGSRNNDNNVLNFQVTNGVVNVSLEYSSDGTGFSSLAAFNTLSGTYSHNTNATVSYYRLKVKLQDGSFKYSNIIKLITGNNTASIVYPNPAKDAITLSVLQEKLLGTTAAIFDSRGSKIMSLRVTDYNSTIDISKLTTGIYYIRLNDLSNIKFIKQ